MSVILLWLMARRAALMRCVSGLTLAGVLSVVCVVPAARAQPLLTPEQRDSLMREMTPEQRQRLWQQLTPEQKGDFMRNLTPEQRAGLAAQMTPEQRERLRARLREDRQRLDADGTMRGRLSSDERQRLREQIIESQRDRREGPQRRGGRADRPPEGADK
ncbi:MAG: magnesium transporter MgtE N-terminal domain-containing protein [Betaproteobacteria bacterium]